MARPIETRTVDCPLCSSAENNYKFTANLGLSIVQCRNCTLQYANPQPTPEGLKQFYDEGLGRWTDEEVYRQTRLPYFKYYINLIQQHFNGGIKTAMDIGCGTGIFLETVKKDLGLRTVGLEISQSDVTVARTRVDEVHEFDLGSTAPTDTISKADVATAFDVFEHLPNPNQAMQNLNALTNDGSLLIIDTGNVAGFGARIGKSRNPFV